VAVSSSTRLEAVMVSIRARDPRAGAGLAAQFAAEPQAGIRAWIVRGVAQLKAPEAPALCRTALQDRSALVRLAAVEALADASGPDAVADLAAVLEGETNAGVRHAAVERLGAIATPASEAVLAQALNGDEDANVRVQAARSLQRHGSASARRALRAAAGADADAGVRRAAGEGGR
jgi:HEAT repeat protein